MSSHLTRVKQHYWQHFFHAISYSYMAFKASCYFFVHAYFPDLFEFDGSNQIANLNAILADKKRRLFL